jgi:nucleotide-binding universal stress UspA family protein
MDRFRNVLMLYPEHHPEAVRQVARFLRQTSARLTVADILPPILADMRWLPPGMSPAEFERLLELEQQETIWSHCFANASDRPEGMQVRLLRGKTPVALIQEAMRRDHDLVIKVATGQLGLPGLLFGTTATKLMRKCPTPVWLIKPDRRLLPARVLAAVDPMGESAIERDLNHRILDLTASIAAFAGGMWEALHCWRVPGESLLSHGRTRMAPDDLARLGRMTESMHRERLDALLRTAPAAHGPSAVHLIKGEPGAVIPSFAHKHGIDLIVMGTVSRPGVAGWLAGATAERVLREAECSLMTVKPSGFVSPVAVDSPSAPGLDRDGMNDA